MGYLTQSRRPSLGPSPPPWQSVVAWSLLKVYPWRFILSQVYPYPSPPGFSLSRLDSSGNLSFSEPELQELELELPMPELLMPELPRSQPGRTITGDISTTKTLSFTQNL